MIKIFKFYESFLKNAYILHWLSCDKSLENWIKIFVREAFLSQEKKKALESFKCKFFKHLLNFFG